MPTHVTDINIAAFRAYLDKYLPEAVPRIWRKLCAEAVYREQVRRGMRPSPEELDEMALAVALEIDRLD